MKKQKTNVGALSVRNAKKNLPNCAQKGNKGITLVALIITIILLLLLAVVAIRAVQGDGIISHAKNSQTKYNIAQEEEQIKIALNEWKIAQNLPGNTKTMEVFLSEKLTGASVTDQNKYVQITMPSDRIYKIDKITNQEYIDLNPSGTIPEGATYTTGIVYNMGTIDESNARKYNDDDNFPETLTPGDRYEYGDYTYYYSVGMMGTSIIIPNNRNVWNVIVNDTSKSSYGTIVESINGQPVADMQYTFLNCTSLTTAPTIPSSITDMGSTFQGCTNLTTAPTIPSSVTNMQSTFFGCTSLTTAPTIPSAVTGMNSTFYGCTSLTTAPTIPSSVTDMGGTFNGCTSLTTAPTIPSSVTSLLRTFQNCTSLKGNVEINGNPSVQETFYNCAQDEAHRITITGAASQETKDALKATGYNSGEFISIE